MGRRRQSITATVARGLLAGVAGTALMTVHQEVVGRRKRRGDEPEGDSGQSEPRDPWEDAPAPAQVARMLLGLAGVRDLSAERIPLLTNAMHWLYGTSWGLVYAVSAHALGRDRRVPGSCLRDGSLGRVIP